MRVALFGGSFNPPHVGHQMAALYVLETNPIDELWVIPCWQHPFDKPLAPFADRFRMCELALLALGPRVRVDAIEKTLGGKSHTLNTIEALQTLHPGVSFSLMVGADLGAEIDSWYGADRLRAIVSFIMVGRQGHAPVDQVAIPDVSSTEIRTRLATGQSVAGLVPARVLDFIHGQGLYVAPDAEA